MQMAKKAQKNKGAKLGRNANRVAVESVAEKPGRNADGQRGGDSYGDIDGKVAPTPFGSVPAVGSEKAANDSVEETVAGCVHAARIIPHDGRGGNA